MEKILGVEVTITIPEPMGARIIVVPVVTTLTIEERGKKAGLTMVLADKSKPRPTLGIVIALPLDPFMRENFKIGEGVYFNGLAGTDMYFEGKTFRSLEFNEIISKVPEEKVPEPYKLQVRHFLISPPDTTGLV